LAAQACGESTAGDSNNSLSASSENASTTAPASGSGGATSTAGANTSGSASGGLPASSGDGEPSTGGSGGEPSTGGSGGDLSTGGNGGDLSTGGSGGGLSTGGSGGGLSTGGSGGASEASTTVSTTSGMECKNGGADHEFCLDHDQMMQQALYGYTQNPRDPPRTTQEVEEAWDAQGCLPAYWVGSPCCNPGITAGRRSGDQCCYTSCEGEFCCSSSTSTSGLPAP
jgi:hypothetical protein